MTSVSDLTDINADLTNVINNDIFQIRMKRLEPKYRKLTQETIGKIEKRRQFISQNAKKAIKNKKFSKETGNNYTFVTRVLIKRSICDFCDFVLIKSSIERC